MQFLLASIAVLFFVAAGFALLGALIYLTVTGSPLWMPGAFVTIVAISYILKGRKS